MADKEDSPKVLQAFRYIGGKSRLAPWIISYMPKHELYVEPMGGSAAVLLSKERSKGEIYNDIDGEMCNFMMQVRDHYDKLQWKIERTPFARKIFDQWKSEFKQNRMPSDPIERAARWFFVQESFWRGKWGGGWFAHTGASQFLTHSKRLEEISKRLQRVAIESGEDYRVVVGKFDSEHTFFYFDPPYLLEDGTNTDYFAWYQNRELFDHEALAKLLVDKGIEGKWLLTYYDVSQIREMYAMPGIHSVTREQTVSTSSTKGKPAMRRTTILLANFPLEDEND